MHIVLSLATCPGYTRPKSGPRTFIYDLDIVEVFAWYHVPINRC